jgi:CRISPR-associated exonuclease Cas4
MSQSDYLPISMLNQYEYCPRRFWYMHVLGEMDVNAAVLEGTYQHEKAHETGASREGETTTHRRVFVWSDRLQIAGFADVVEESFDPLTTLAQDKARVLTPIEYKHGRMGRWLNDHIQLCAQALCIEERLVADGKWQVAGGKWHMADGQPSTSNIQRPTSNVQLLTHGEIFYWGSRRRERVEFTPELRARTEQSIAQVFTLLRQGHMPAPIAQRAKCKDCSLQPICLPDEVMRMQLKPRRREER